MAQDVSCRLLCNTPTNPVTWKKDESLLVIERIQHEYTVHLYDLIYRNGQNTIYMKFKILIIISA